MKGQEPDMRMCELVKTHWRQLATHFSLHPRLMGGLWSVVGFARVFELSSSAFGSEPSVQENTDEQ